MNDIFNQINLASTSEQSRQLLVAYLKESIPAIEESSEKSVVCAYAITGIMATDYARTLATDDPIEEILSIAGELETNPTNTEELRRELASKIKALQ